MENLFEIKNRMCRYQANHGCCEGCDIGILLDADFQGCRDYLFDYPKETEEILLKWAKENPLRTRKDVFLEQYPNAEILKDGYPNIDPCILDESILDFTVYGICEKSCIECKKEFWNEVL